MRALVICSDINFFNKLKGLQIEENGKFEILDRATNMGVAMELSSKLKPDIAVIDTHEREFGDTLGGIRLLKEGLVEMLVSLDFPQNQLSIYRSERQPYTSGEDVFTALDAS